jgi:hypothetical protein
MNIRLIGFRMPKNKRTDETLLYPASSKGKSLRVIIPAFIICSLDLKKGDRLRWTINGKRLEAIIVKCNDNGN